MTRMTDRLLRDHMRHWKIWTRNRQRIGRNVSNDIIRSKLSVPVNTPHHRNVYQEPLYRTRRITKSDHNNNDIRYLLIRAIDSLVFLYNIDYFIITLTLIIKMRNAKQRKAVRNKEVLTIKINSNVHNSSNSRLYVTPFKYYNPNKAIITSVKNYVDRPLTNPTIRLVVLGRSLKICIASLKRMVATTKVITSVINAKKKYDSSGALRLLISNSIRRNQLRYHYNYKHYYNHQHYHYCIRIKYTNIIRVIVTDKILGFFVTWKQLVYFKKLKTCFVAIKSLRKRMIMMIKANKERIKKINIWKETIHVYDEHYVNKVKNFFIKR